MSLRSRVEPTDPVDAVTADNPYGYYARLVAERPLYFDHRHGLWVVSSAPLVEECLESRDFGVRPASEPLPPALAGSLAGDVFLRLIRMTDGSRHRQCRPVVTGAMSALTVSTIETAAAKVIEDLAQHIVDEPLTRRLDRFVAEFPLGVTARLAGVSRDALPDVTRHIAAFVAALRPGSTMGEVERGMIAAGNLVEQFDRPPAPDIAPLRLPHTPTVDHATAVANTIGLLVQTYEATAGLIGNALVQLQRDDASGVPAPEIDERFLREVARFDAPVQNTRRYALRDCLLGGASLRWGDAVLVVLAAANRDPAVNPNPHDFDPDRRAARLFTWGHGSHQCPGQQLSLAIARIGLAALRATITDHATLPTHIGYRPLGNARIPVFSDSSA